MGGCPHFILNKEVMFFDVMWPQVPYTDEREGLCVHGGIWNFQGRPRSSFVLMERGSGQRKGGNMW